MAHKRISLWSWFEMSEKMYGMFCLDGSNYKKKMNNKIMWEEMGSINGGMWRRDSYMDEDDLHTNLIKPKKQEYVDKINERMRY